jgi:4-amino-4-deoxy-L-arabinose transferase-like glycosyltransferase
MKFVDYSSIHHRLTSPDKPIGYWLALTLILIVGLSLRLPNLNESLWNDEIWSTHVLIGSLRALYQTAIDDRHPPFYHAFMFVWIRLFGDSELSVRMPSFICGIFAILLVYVFASRVVERKTALLASFLLAVSPAHIWYSQEARSYSMLLSFLLLSLFAYLKLKEPAPHRVWFLVYFGSLFSCALTHYYLAVYVILVSMVCLLERHRRKWYILSINFLILVCLAAWIITIFIRTGAPIGGGYLGAFTFRALWRLFFTWFLFGDAWGEQWRHWQMFSAQLFFLTIFVYGLAMALLLKKTKGNARTLAIYLFAIPVFLLVATYFGFRGYIERSVLVALPFFHIVIAKGIICIADASESIRPGSYARAFVKSLAGACIVVVILLSVFTLKEYFRRDEEWTVYKPNPDWRSAARYLESGINASSDGSSGQLAIFAAVPPLELTYYNSRFINIWLGLVEGQDTLTGEESRAYWEIYSIGPAYLKNFEKFHEALSRTGARAFYLIHNKYWSGDFDRVFKHLMNDPRVQYQNMKSFKGIEIHEFKTAPRVTAPRAVLLARVRNDQNS